MIHPKTPTTILCLMTNAPAALIGEEVTGQTRMIPPDNENDDDADSLLDDCTSCHHVIRALQLGRALHLSLCIVLLIIESNGLKNFIRVNSPRCRKKSHVGMRNLVKNLGTALKFLHAQRRSIRCRKLSGLITDHYDAGLTILVILLSLHIPRCRMEIKMKISRYLHGFSLT